MRDLTFGVVFGFSDSSLEGTQYNLTLGESIGISDSVVVTISFTVFELFLGRMIDTFINALEFLTQAPTLLQFLLTFVLPITLINEGAVTPVPSLPNDWEKLRRNLPGKIDRCKISVVFVVVGLLSYILGLSENLTIASGHWGWVLLFGGSFLAIALLMCVLVLMAKSKL
ncbi:MAG: hypothetical protein ACE5H4_00765 [Candidatus Thorarchaeota archaeon]